MKTKVHSTAGVLALIAGMFLAPVFRGQSAEPVRDDFQLVKSEKNINLFIRPIRMNEGYTVRQLKAVFIVNANPEEVVALIKEEKRTTSWMKAVSTCKSLSKISDDQWISYLVFSVPWPLNDQDCIFRFRKQADATGAITLDFISDHGYLKPIDGIKRMKGVKGSWIITPLGNGTSKVEYCICSDQKPSLPRWLTDPIIQGNLLSSMRAFCDQFNH